MKDPIYTNDIYVGVARFCNRSFLFSPLPLCPPISPLPPPLPQHPLAGIQHREVPAPLGTKTQSGGEDISHVPTQPNSDKVSPEPLSSGVHAYPHGEGPYHMFTSEIFLDPSFMRERPSPGTVPTVAMLPRLQEVA